MKKPKSQNTSALLQSIKIINSILKDEGKPNETHVLLQGGWATAHNGILGIGEKIAEDLNISPNAKTLEAALAKCGQQFSITQLETRLSVKSDKFRALVPCMPAESLYRSFPDSPCAQIGEPLRASFEALAPIEADETSALTASLLLKGGSLLATDRKIIIESYHGQSMPTLAIPKSFIKLVNAVKKSIKSFGFSNSSFTLHLENDSWIKTQLWNNEWPDVNSVLDCKAELNKFPEDFWIAIESLKSFSDDGWLYSRNNKLHTHLSDDKGASFDCYGMPPDVSIAINHMEMIKNWATVVDFFAKTNHGLNCIKVQGDSTRAVIAGRR